MSEYRRTPNKLIDENSPYLQQHAYNPVYWFPWCEEAFEKARLEDKPVFVSIGYSTCHWCHVMAHESFEDDQVASLLNRYFVSVKVDKEERPDVDAVYMDACQMMTGGGGWPLSVFMDADQKPFFVGTYFPKRSRFGQAGLLELLAMIIRQWQGSRERLLEAGDDLIELLNTQSNETTPNASVDKSLVKSGAQLLLRMYDAKNGGFGTAPKFPTPHNLLFLLRYFVLEKDDRCLNAASHTLTQMARGGIFDHIGGGFSRYSTDERWLVPHFEKMLYDNALLSMAYCDAYAVTRSTFLRQAAERTIAYTLRELMIEEGGFCCGQDADSDGVEGKYYVFTPDEIISALGDADGPWFNRTYDMTEVGNFDGTNIPNLLKCRSYESVYGESKALLAKLYRYRRQRTSLHRDDKVLTSWNALMIAALCDAAVLFEEETYLTAAVMADAFVQRNLTQPDGKLYLRFRGGESKYAGHLDDYAFYAWAQLCLYRATFDPSYLSRAASVAKWMLDLFFDEENGGFFLYAKDAEQLISRPKEVYDGAIPSGNSVAAFVLGSLYALSGEPLWQEAQEKQLGFLASRMHANPAAQSFALLAMCQALYPSQELVCACRDDSMLPLSQIARIARDPGITVIVKTHKNANLLAIEAPWTAAHPIPLEGAAYYLCQNGTCTQPTADLGEVLRRIGKANP